MTEHAHTSITHLISVTIHLSHRKLNVIVHIGIRLLKDEIVDDLFTNVLFVSFLGMTKKTYVESILEGIKQSKEENVDIDVR